MEINQATKFAREHIAKVTKNLSVEPIWLDEQSFIYQHETEHGKEYLQVDCRTGKKVALPEYQPPEATLVNYIIAHSIDGRHEIFYQTSQPLLS